MKDSGFDFSDCVFINSEMKFYSYREFVENCYAVKRLYDIRLSNNGKLFYKWYLYANIHLTMNQKNRIWDFLNNYCDLEGLKKLLYK